MAEKVFSARKQQLTGNSKGWISEQTKKTEITGFGAKNRCLQI